MIQDLIDRFPDSITQDAIRSHRHLAPGIILGFKMALHALKAIEPFSPEDIIMLTSETTRCIPDGFQAISRYLLMNGGYKVYTRTYDVGKLSMQLTKNYVDQFRLVLDDNYIQGNKDLHAWIYLDKDDQLPLDDLRAMMWKIDVDRAFKEVPFQKRIKKKYKGKNVVECPICGESTSALSMVEENGKLVCKTCVFFEKDDI